LGPELTPLTGPLPTAVTSTGARLQLEAGSVQPATDGQGTQRLTLVGHWLPSPANPAWNVAANPPDHTLSEAKVRFEFPKGPPVTGDNDDFLDDRYGAEPRLGYCTWTCDIPKGGVAATAIVHLDYARNPGFSPTVIQVHLPLPKLGGNTPETEVPTYFQSLGAGKVTLLPRGFRQYGTFMADVIFDMPDSQIDGPCWEVASSWSQLPGGLRFPGGKEFAANCAAYGAPLGPNQSSHVIDAYLGNDWPHPPPKELATTITIGLTCRPLKSTLFHLHFEGLPVPDPGGTISVHREVAAGEYGAFVVNKVAWITGTQTQTTAGNRSENSGQDELAVLLQFVPTRTEPTLAWAQDGSWDLSLASSRDDIGRDLGTPSVTGEYQFRGLGWTDGLSAQKPASKGFYATIYLRPPAPGATTFDFDLDAFRKEWFATKEVKFQDIPIRIPFEAATGYQWPGPPSLFSVQAQSAGTPAKLRFVTRAGSAKSGDRMMSRHQAFRFRRRSGRRPNFRVQHTQSKKLSHDKVPLTHRGARRN